MDLDMPWTSPNHDPVDPPPEAHLQTWIRRQRCDPISGPGSFQSLDHLGSAFRSFPHIHDQLAADFKRLAPKQNAWNKLNLLILVVGLLNKKNKTLSCVEMILDWKLNVALKPSFHHWKGISKLAHVWLPEGKSIDYPLISHYYPNSIPMNLRWSLSISIMIRKKSKELLWGS